MSMKMSTVPINMLTTHTTVHDVSSEIDALQREKNTLHAQIIKSSRQLHRIKQLAGKIILLQKQKKTLVAIAKTTAATVRVKAAAIREEQVKNKYHVPIPVPVR